jgi:hypothetical protein
MADYTLLVDLAKEVQPPNKGILSRTLFNDDRLKAVIFGFVQGEELSEHTASMPAILHFLQGEATVTLGDDKHEAKSWHLGPHANRPAAQHPGEDAGGHAIAADEVKLATGKGFIRLAATFAAFKVKRRC